MKLNLQITFRGNSSLHELLLEVPATVGRRSKNSISILDPKISGIHCRFLLTKKGLKIFDLDSKNGTYLNSIKIEESEIFVGDQIKIGDCLIIIDERNLDDEANLLLKFPGSYRARVAQEIEVDFTSVRNKNQLNLNGSILSREDLMNSHNNEVHLRKKIKSSIKLSPDEIRSNHLFLYIWARFIDISLVSILIFFTFVLIDGAFEDEVKVMILTSEVILLMSLNFRAMKFSIGEKIVGIQTRYQEQ